LDLGSRFVIKFSGEGLGRKDHGLWEPGHISALGMELASLAKERGSQVAVILGGGNIVRGPELKRRVGLKDGVAADNIGMLATIMNCLVLQDSLEGHHGLKTRLMTAWAMPHIGEVYIRRRAIRHMEKGRIVILAGGTGNPDCSTDKALTQFGYELRADLLLKASKVDGIFTGDPKVDNGVSHIPYLSYAEFLSHPERYRQILDRSAVTQAEQHGMVIRVFNAQTPEALRNVILENGQSQFSDVGPAQPGPDHTLLLRRNKDAVVTFGDDDDTGPHC